MEKIFRRWAVIAALSVVQPAWSVTADLQLVGLAVHQETGREIYLGAIHVDKLVPPPADLAQFTGPKAMEYRVVARRTSIRSLLGSILLQAELASGSPASNNTATFIDDIMAVVQGSLYAGDALDIALNSNDETVATLNGHELARSVDGTVFDYLLHGWLGEKGASADFRATLLAPDIDQSLLAAYRAHEASAERVAAIGAWVAPEPSPVSEQEATEAAATPLAVAVIGNSDSPATVETAETKELQQGPAAEVIPAVATVTTLERTETLPEPSNNVSKREGADIEVAAEPLQLAAITPQGSLLTPDPALIQVLSLADYSQRLAEFNSMIVRKVYARIRYPKSAVRRNLQGSLELDLHLNADGSLNEAVVVSGSGHNTLDAAAVRAAESAFSDSALEQIDTVAVSEYRDQNGRLVVPVPISFRLTE